MFSICKCKRAF